MTDHVDPAKRSDIMRAVRSKNTGPEVRLRKLIFSLGYRYRIHYSKLPGKPDLVFVKRKKVIFVHGCYWHGHGCNKGRTPKSNVAFWQAKIARNRQRDEEIMERLTSGGWKVLVVWQCELQDLSAVTKRVIDFLGQVK